MKDTLWVLKSIMYYMPDPSFFAFHFFNGFKSYYNKQNKIKLRISFKDSKIFTCIKSLRDCMLSHTSLLLRDLFFFYVTWNECRRLTLSWKCRRVGSKSWNGFDAAGVIPECKQVGIRSSCVLHATNIVPGEGVGVVKEVFVPECHRFCILFNSWGAFLFIFVLTKLVNLKRVTEYEWK